MNNLPWRVAVLIPARDEEQLLPRCLQSVLSAMSCVPDRIRVDVVVVADSSTDRTSHIAEDILGSRGSVVRASAGVAGTARRLAATSILGRIATPLNRCWLANTDADCVVPSSWILDQLQLASHGVEAIAGTVSVDCFDEHGPEVGARFRMTYKIEPDGTHPHVHGANLGLRADAYLRAGGWADLATAEDHDLWGRLVRNGARTVSTSRIEVVTSGRRTGRAPNGFARALAAHNGSH